MKVAVIGFGIDGRVAVPYWAKKGAEVTVCDGKESLEGVPDGIELKLGADHMKYLDQFDVIYRTSGIHPQTILDANPDHPEIASRITSGIPEFLRVCPSRNIIGITGTKGKGTTSTLVARMLEKAGKTVHLGGNIGIAALEMLPRIKEGDIVVLELSSFQLIDCQERVPTAACLMIAPEHLNWHANMKEYIDAKAQLFLHQAPEDRAIYSATSKDSGEIAAKSPAHDKVAYDVPSRDEALQHTEASYVKDDTIYYQTTPIMPTSEVRILGRHNLENVCAAISIVWPIIPGNLVAIRDVAKTFGGLPHHTEYVTTINDVIFYNDSYSTMPDATIAALQAVPGKKILILGGGSKGLSLEAMMDAVANADLRHVVLMGSLAERLADMLDKRNIHNYSFSKNGMSDIIAESKKHAQAGDVVLLSPGLPAKGDGFFIDNVDRGNQFKEGLGVAATSDH